MTGYERAAAYYGGCPIEGGFIENLADHECRHGALPSDRGLSCDCWVGGVKTMAGSRLEPAPPLLELLPKPVRSTVSTPTVRSVLARIAEDLAA